MTTTDDRRSADGSGIATLLVDNPPLNILDLATMEEVGARLGHIAKDPDLRVLIVAGAGDRAFSAGVAVQDHVADRIEAALGAFHGIVRALRDLDAVTVASVRGHCLGGGLELASACDLVLAARGARFGVPEIELGCYPPVAAAAYPALMGRHRALDLILTGRIVDADEALDLGLVSRVVPDGELAEATDELAATVAGRSAAVNRLVKKVVDEVDARPFDEALERAEEIYLTELVETHDMHEGIAAFLEKRDPEWKNR